MNAPTAPGKEIGKKLNEIEETKEMKTPQGLGLAWSGWRQQLEALTAGSLLLRWGQAASVCTSRLKEAQEVWVDFFPDELPAEAWQRLAPWTNKMVFLPPWVQITPSGNSTNKRFVWSDAGSIYTPQCSFDNQWKEVCSYPPLRLPPSTIGGDIELLNPEENPERIPHATGAASWILALKCPQTEHALWLLAQKHGIPVAFWERAAASPMRTLAGYYEALSPTQDPTLRECIRRVLHPSAIAYPAAQPPQPTRLEDIRQTMSFARLGLAVPHSYSQGRHTRMHLVRSLLAEQPYQQLAQDNLMAPLAASLEKLGSKKRSKEEQAAWERFWPIFTAGILATDGHDVLDLWSKSYGRYPKETLKATLACLQGLLHDVHISWEMWRLVLQGLLLSRAKQADMQEILELIEKNARWQLFDKKDGQEWHVKSILRTLQGQSARQAVTPEEQKFAVARDTYYLQAVEALRTDPEGTLLKQALEMGPPGHFGYLYAAQHVIRLAPHLVPIMFWHPSFQEFRPWYHNHALQHWWHLVCDEALCQKARPALETIRDWALDTPQPDKNSTVSGLCAQIMLGEKMDYPAAYLLIKNTYAQAEGSLVACTLANCGQLAAARQVLASLNLETEDLLFCAAIAMVLEMPLEATRALERLKKQEPQACQARMWSRYEGKILLCTGMIGRATGHSLMADKALERLKASWEWEHLYVRLRHTTQVVAPESLNPELKEWLMQGLE